MIQTQNYKLSVVTLKGTYFYSPGEIIRLEASSNYTTIYLINKKKILITKVLKELAVMLRPFGFVRTHRSHLVNPEYIVCINELGNIIMKDASVAEISRRMKSGVMRVLKNVA